MPGLSDAVQPQLIANFLSMPAITQQSVVFVAVLTIYFHFKFNQQAISNAPTILTTTGIFFTFLGIALGLAEFDTLNVEKSIPSLLGGLKTAFWASVAGVGGALSIKIRHNFFGIGSEESAEGVNTEITAEDVARLLRGIQNALVGNDESTIVSQLKLTRQDTNDRLDALRRAQQEALQRLSEMGSAKLVDALREVIRDFNSKINEQFGENFKELNLAVGKLVDWQGRYKDHTDQLARQIVEITDSMKNATERFSELVEKAGAFSAISRDLSSLLQSLQVQKEQLVGSLKALANLLQAASGSLPQIESKIMDLATQLSNAVRQAQLEVNKSVAENGLLLRTSAQEATKQVAIAISEQQKELARHLTDHVDLIRNSIQTIGQDLSRTNSDFNKQIMELSAKTKEQVTVLDAALSEELKKSLESLGRQLAALSKKFVDDYSPLTDKLRRVVEMARG